MVSGASTGVPPGLDEGEHPVDATSDLLVDHGSSSVVVDSDGNSTQVVLGGEIDAAYRQELLEAAGKVVAAGLPVRVLADRVSFMDCAGVAFLARMATGSGAGRVTVVNAPVQVRRLLEVTGLTTLLTLEDSA